MTPKAKEVGYRIRKIREAKDLNQQNMADKLEITAGAYAKIERGETDPSITRIFEIAAILKVDIINLLQDTKTETGHNDNPILQQQIDTISKELNQLKKDFKKISNPKK